MAKDISQKYLPFRSKRKVDGQDVEYGRYKWYNPYTKSLEYLDNPDYDSSYARTRELLRSGTLGGMAVGAESTGDEGTSDTPTPSFDAAKVMDLWATDKPTPPAMGDSTVANATTQSPPPGGVTLPIIRPVVKAPTKQKGLTPEQAIKLGKTMQKVVAKLNIAALDGCIRLLGRDPFPLEEDDIELLALGWEMFLDEFFIKHPPKPWMLILVGNVMCASVMYLRGTPIKSDDDVVITEGEMEGAPGHERVTP